MDEKRFGEILGAFGEVRIAVAGDFFLDRLFYIEREWDEPSVETGLTAYQAARRKCAPGAAGTITNNLAALGIKKIYAVALAGDDGEAFDLLKGLQSSGVDTSFVVREPEIFTPTYTKTFFDYPDRKEETNRIDIKNRKPTPERASLQLAQNILALEGKTDAIICLEQITDSDTGVFTAPVLDALAEISARGKVKVIADSRFNITKFRGVIPKCNDAELLRAAGFPDDGADDAARFALVDEAMKKIAGASPFPMFVSCGARGFKVLSDGKITGVPTYSPPGPLDICGAGDSALAGLTCALCAGASREEAALFGNLLASLTIQQIGVTGAATRAQLAARFGEYVKSL
jgi:sugar/nucleoside kinase (ribokinase family)